MNACGKEKRFPVLLYLPLLTLSLLFLTLQVCHSNEEKVSDTEDEKKEDVVREVAWKTISLKRGLMSCLWGVFVVH